MKVIVTIIALVSLCYVQGQVAGINTFDFLELTQPARIASMGGSNVSISDNDPNMATVNPALLNADKDQFLALNFVNYFAGINYGNTSFVKHFDSIGTFQANLLYANYGKFQYADETGQLQGGTFVANDISFNVSYARPIDTNFSVGANLNIINSVLESYHSFGVALDFGGAYVNKAREFSAGLVVKNLGVQLIKYDEGDREKLPFQIQAGFSKKLKHAPFRFSLTLNDLQRWDLTQRNPNLKPETDPLTGEIIPIQDPGFLDKAARHVVLGGELLLGKSFQISGGFNYRRRAELRLESRPGLTGFSIGAGVKIKKFQFTYARSSYHRAGGTNSFSVSTNLGYFRK